MWFLLILVFAKGKQLAPYLKCVRLGHIERDRAPWHQKYCSRQTEQRRKAVVLEYVYRKNIHATADSTV